MFNIESLSSIQCDALKEIGNIGAGHAATALSQLLAEKIEMTVPNVSIIPFGRASEVVGGPERLVAGIYTQVYGDAPGKMVFFFPYGEALQLLDIIMNRTAGVTQSIGEIEQSAITEIVNIMTGAYLGALIRFTNLNLLPSVPSFACDMAGAIINTVLSDLGVLGDYALLIETQFSLVERKLEGHFFYVPDPGALEKILGALGVWTG
jgi:chemotaxis protein CheC